ncbi:signal peptidase I [Salimicrobium salexigens]|uniref:Signal peptidase I n=1 Tax=Salimicrobium salexigens TaxID=908941 RepID=A0ABY1KKA6_9BACI|nr:signal peptidase I [Salimicrobium salexigens]SIS44877.1 signal peptidase I [Salimicrobium salexigens]
MNKHKYLFRAVILAALVALVFRTFIFASYIVDGESMEPTLYDGNLLMVNKVSYEWTEIHRQDVIVFHYNEKDDYVKRVIGLPGDEIAVKDDELYVNDERLEETYLDKLRPEDGEVFTSSFTLEGITGIPTVPPGKLFVLGDNRRHSLDSRSFGFIDSASVVGKVSIRYWPMSQVGVTFQ